MLDIDLTPFLLIVGVVAAIAIVGSVFFNTPGKDKGAVKYHYRRKQFIMTAAEHKFFDALLTAIGSDYHIFIQIHLPSIVQHEHSTNGAFRHIDEKNVDFVLCDKNYLSPKLVIELDDKTHERADRQGRDTEIDRILSEAGLPILHFVNHGVFDPDDIRRQISGILGQQSSKE